MGKSTLRGRKATAAKKLEREIKDKRNARDRANRAKIKAGRTTRSIVKKPRKIKSKDEGPTVKSMTELLARELSQDQMIKIGLEALALRLRRRKGVVTHLEKIITLMEDNNFLHAVLLAGVIK